ncbi:hypothetical protein ACIRA2_15185 [Streptomyces griseoviridis]
MPSVQRALLSSGRRIATALVVFVALVTTGALAAPVPASHPVASLSVPASAGSPHQDVLPYADGPFRSDSPHQLRTVRDQLAERLDLPDQQAAGGDGGQVVPGPGVHAVASDGWAPGFRGRARHDRDRAPPAPVDV